MTEREFTELVSDWKTKALEHNLLAARLDRRYSGIILRELEVGKVKTVADRESKAELECNQLRAEVGVARIEMEAAKYLVEWRAFGKR